jgi:uncharacterized protein (TIGR03067 family)
MSMARFTLVLLSVLVGHAARAEDPVADEVKRLQGVWQVVGVESGGKRVGKGDPKLKNLRFVFKGGELTLTRPDGGELKRSFTVDPSETPKELDITWVDSRGETVTVPCIYKLGEGQLVICMPSPVKKSSERPEKFETAAGDGVELLTLEKAKDK